ncbi:hypothetical protein F931_01545 [Acinetobacter pittii ANC 4050]|uniref:Lipoprotein n=1 Tax=Acinetobacter pittii ANC 4050 TaxID=1217691 RepID=R8YMX5_ACIPI|nr:hypothetical protein F931_01545 [Acinetobacter pittii ANC 4050]
MNLKNIFTIALIFLLSACTSKSSVIFTEFQNESILTIRPRSGHISLTLRCNLISKNPTLKIYSPVNLEKKFAFYTDGKYEVYYSGIKNDRYVFSQENSKKILNSMYKSKTLVIKTSSGVKTSIQLEGINKVIRKYFTQCL